MQSKKCFFMCVQFFPGRTEGCGESETLCREAGYRPDGGEDELNVTAEMFKFCSVHRRPADCSI